MLKTIIRGFVLGAGALTLLCISPMVSNAAVCFIGLNEETGSTYWVSCGSSAGNTVWRCPAGGGTCTVVDTDGGAAFYCLTSGCGGGGDGGGGGLMSMCLDLPMKPAGRDFKPTTGQATPTKGPATNIGFMAKTR